ncbi:ABC-three component system protein [Pectobacterium colocasium]|uniref:ABC-three component system protein n=1 Tax=Pectobacterium colocasium TaxID=2878098 RepID=UPI003B27FADE
MAENRGTNTHNKNLALCDEVNGLCPKCNKALLKKTKKSLVKVYEIAHIYPHSPHPHEVTLLKYEERLTEDAEDIGNLIALCKDCHKVFDNPRTVEGYREMCKLKKASSQNALIKNSLSTFHLTEDINFLIGKLSELSGSSSVKLEFDAKTIETKLPNEKEFLLKFKVQGYVNYFYHDIFRLFQEIEQLKPGTSELIFTEVKVHYLSLKRDGVEKDKIFESLVEWVHLTCESKNRIASETLISFFIQNCEVF